MVVGCQESNALTVIDLRDGKVKQTLPMNTPVCIVFAPMPEKPV